MENGGSGRGGAQEAGLRPGPPMRLAADGNGGSGRGGAQAGAGALQDPPDPPANGGSGRGGAQAGGAGRKEGGAGAAPFLEIRGLSVEYGGGGRGGGRPLRALDGATLSAGRGECVGIAGASACGKSTLGLAVMRALRGGTVTGGSIALGGHSVLDEDGGRFDSHWRWKRISMVFQGAMSSLDPVFTVREQFEEALGEHRREDGGRGRGRGRDALIADAVRSVGLDAGVLSKYPHELSGGMKQRVVIALALILRPELVIADEPTTALDVLVQAQIISLLKRLKSDEGITLMFITHDLAVLSEVADRIAVMYAGQTVEFGPAKQVYLEPRHPYTQGLLASVPTLRGPVQEPPASGGWLDMEAGATAAVTAAAADAGGREAEGGCRFARLCPHAFDRCSEDPPDVPMPEGGYAKCWLYDGDGNGRGAGGGAAGQGRPATSGP